MTAQDYILSRLEELAQPLPSLSDSSDMVALIYKQVMSKKFRKYSVSPEYQQHIKSAIETCVAKNEPIKFTLVFGGYKLWRLKEAPEADWAELFSLMYFAQWLKPVAALYTPGVWFDFYSDDVIVETMNNIPRSDTERYQASFKALLTFIKPYLPKNLVLTFNRVGDAYENDTAFQAELRDLIEKNKAQLDQPLTPEQIASVEMNVKLNPGQSDDPIWREKINLIHDAYTQVSKRRPYYRTEDKIMVITRPVKNTIAVGTTKRSVVKFWIGVGVLLCDNEAYVETIYSPKQLNEGKFTRQDISIPGLDSSNFTTIRVAVQN